MELNCCQRFCKKIKMERSKGQIQPSDIYIKILTILTIISMQATRIFEKATNKKTFFDPINSKALDLAHRNSYIGATVFPYITTVLSWVSLSVQNMQGFPSTALVCYWDNCLLSCLRLGQQAAAPVNRIMPWRHPPWWGPRVSDSASLKVQ